MTMKTIAIITARGGSKRIPRKNIKEFAGEPIIAYPIRAAKESGLFDEIMVSTDSEEIADIARSYGAGVPFMRSSENADDVSTTADVISEVIACYGKEGAEFDVICCLYPTSPFITGDLLREAFGRLEESGAAAVLPVVAYSHPVQRALVIRDNELSYKWPENRNARTQDLEKCYHDAGQFYFVRTEAFLREKTMVPEGTAPFVLEEKLVQDIDTVEDWEIAEFKYRYLTKE